LHLLFHSYAKNIRQSIDIPCVVISAMFFYSDWSILTDLILYETFGIKALDATCNGLKEYKEAQKYFENIKSFEQQKINIEEIAGKIAPIKKNIRHCASWGNALTTIIGA
jgi:hypothetical protein